MKDDPQSLARLATRAEVRRPGTMERTFGGMGGRGMGVGGMMAGSFLASMAGVVIGSAIAQSFLGDSGHGDTAEGEGNSGDMATDTSADAGSDAGDFDGGDFGESDAQHGVMNLLCKASRLLVPAAFEGGGLIQAAVGSSGPTVVDVTMRDTGALKVGARCRAEHGAPVAGFWQHVDGAVLAAQRRRHHVVVERRATTMQPSEMRLSCGVEEASHCGRRSEGGAGRRRWIAHGGGVVDPDNGLVFIVVSSGGFEAPGRRGALPMRESAGRAPRDVRRRLIVLGQSQQHRGSPGQTAVSSEHEQARVLLVDHCERPA